jgi:hypothetical protein
VSEELLDITKSLKARGPHPRWNSFRQALNSVWKEHGIEALSSRLERYWRQLDTTLLVSIREQVQRNGAGFGSTSPNSAFLRLNQRCQVMTKGIMDLLRNNWQSNNKPDRDMFSSQLSVITKN